MLDKYKHQAPLLLSYVDVTLPFFHQSHYQTTDKSSKPEPGEVSPHHSSTSSKKEDSLKRDRESQALDSEEEGDLLEDEDEVSVGRKEKKGSTVSAKLSTTKQVTAK